MILAKRLNQSRCRSGFGLTEAQGNTFSWGPREGALLGSNTCADVDILDRIRKGEVRQRCGLVGTSIVATCLFLTDGLKSLDDWREGWKDALGATNKMQTTRWTVDRQSASYLADQASANATDRCSHAEEFLVATFDKYKHAKEHELMRQLMVTFAGMPGTDRGAISREFFYLTFEACISGTYKGTRLMTGERGRLIPTNDDSTMDAFRCLDLLEYWLKLLFGYLMGPCFTYTFAIKFGVWHGSVLSPFCLQYI